jgi:hypothetical protein
MNTATHTKHTAEPFAALPWTHHLIGQDIRILADDGERVAGKMAEANAARIVACVNACAGIEDPAATLAKVRADLRRYSAHLEAEAQRAGMGFMGLDSLRALGA